MENIMFIFVRFHCYWIWVRIHESKINWDSREITFSIQLRKLYCLQLLTTLTQCCESVTFWYGSVPMTYGSRFGSGSRSCFFRQWLTGSQQKINFFPKFLCLLLLKVHLFTSVLKDKKSKTSHKKGKIKVFLTFLFVDGRIR